MVKKKKTRKKSVKPAARTKQNGTALGLLGDLDSNIRLLGKSMRKLDKRMTKVEGVAMAPGRRSISLPGSETEIKKRGFYFTQLIKGIIWGEWGDGFERDLCIEARKKWLAQEEGQREYDVGGAKRVMSAGTDSAGGYIVPVEALGELIELLRPESVVMGMGATVLNNLTGSPVEISKQTGGATGYWPAENAAITASDLAVGMIQLTPKNAAALVKLSKRLVRLSSPSAEAMVREDLATTLALLVDIAALEGIGSAGQPRGIELTPAVTELVIGTNGGIPTFDIMQDLEGLVEDQDALRGRTGFITHPKVLRILKRQKVQGFSGQVAGEREGYVFAPVMTDAQLAERLGHAFAKTTQLSATLTKGSSTACAKCFFGNWADLLIGMWGGLEIEASTQAGDSSGGAFSSNQVWVKANMEVDVQARHGESFAFTKDIGTTDPVA